MNVSVKDPNTINWKLALHAAVALAQRCKDADMCITRGLDARFVTQVEHAAEDIVAVMSELGLTSEDLEKARTRLDRLHAELDRMARRAP